MKYFGFGTNKDLDMMIHMVGNQNLKGVKGKLIGYELCIQDLNQIRDEIIPPFDISPRQIIKNGHGDSFKLYVTRPNPSAAAYGTIWDLTAEELELVKNWELVDFGMQEEVKAMAMDDNGNMIEVETQALMRDPREVEKIVSEENYEAYIAPKDKMLKIADEAREDFLKRPK